MRTINILAFFTIAIAFITMPTHLKDGYQESNTYQAQQTTPTPGAPGPVTAPDDIPSCSDLASPTAMWPIEKEPLDVLLFLDESNSAYWTSDPPPTSDDDLQFRYQMAHLIVDFLFADAQLRGVQNQISVWVYAGETRSITNGPQPLTPERLAHVHTTLDEENKRFFGEALQKTDLPNVFEEALLEYESRSGPKGKPVLMILNDMSGSGIEDVEAMVREVSDIWESVANNGYVFLLDFNSKNSELELRSAWEEYFFSDSEVQGGLRRINQDNKLSIVMNIITDITSGQISYQWLTTRERQETICPENLCPERVVFALIRNHPTVDASVPASSSSERADPISDYSSGYSLVYQALEPESLWTLSREGTEQDVLYAISTFGGFQFSLIPEIVAAGEEIQVKSGVFRDDGTLHEEAIEDIDLDWKAIDDMAWQNAAHIATNPIPEWLFTAPSVTSDRFYQVRLRANGYDPIICWFKIVPQVLLEIIEVDFDKEPQVRIRVENYHKLKARVNGAPILPTVRLVQNGLEIVGQVSLSDQVNGEFVVTFEEAQLADANFKDTGPWEVVASLSGRTTDEVIVELGDQRMVIISIATPTPAPSGTPQPIPTAPVPPEPEPEVPRPPLYALIIGAIVMFLVVIANWKIPTGEVENE